MLRLAGAGRAETAAAVVAATVGSEPPVVFLATGDAFPDALAGGPAAAVSGGPILLATSSGIPSATLEEMERLSPERIVLLGGSAALGPEVETAAAEIAPVERIAGSDRISTAAAISAATFPDGSNVAYIATGSDFPDALAGGAVAGADGAPLLLADAGGLPGATRDELQRLDPERIVLLGGAAALPGTLEQALTDELGAEVVRLAGSDRTSTAAAIAERFPSGSTGVAVLATGENFPDALAATPTAAAYGAPLLLTTGDALAGPAAAALERIGPSRLLAVGGTGPLPESVVEAAADLLAQPTDPSGDALEFFRIAGQFLSGLLQFGDIRDFLINLARGDSPAALLSLIGLIPGGELLRGIGYIDESINLALRTEDAVGILSRGNIAGELVTEIVDQTLRHVDDPSVVAEDDVRCPVGNRSAFTQAFPGGTTINGTVAGIPLTNTYISSAATSAFLACLGTTPAELADFTISGRYGDAVAEYAAAQRGWTVRSTPSYPSDNGVDAVYALPGGRLIVTENKGTTGTGTLGGTNLGATPSNPLPPELSMDWLFGPIDPDTEERSPAANSAVNRSVPRRIDASLAETLYLLANTDQAFEREIVIARARYVAFPVRPTIVTRTQLNGTDGGPRLRQITVYQVLSSEQ